MEFGIFVAKIKHKRYIKSVEEENDVHFTVSLTIDHTL